MEKVQTAAHCVARAADHGGPMIFAQMGMLQAIDRHHKRVVNPDRKDTHWGKRKLKRDQPTSMSPESQSHFAFIDAAAPMASPPTLRPTAINLNH